MRARTISFYLYVHTHTHTAFIRHLLQPICQRQVRPVTVRRPESLFVCLRAGMNYSCDTKVVTDSSHICLLTAPQTAQALCQGKKIIFLILIHVSVTTSLSETEGKYLKLS